MPDLTSPQQYGRKASLLVTRAAVNGNNPSAFVAGSTIDLSNMHFRFRTAQQDVESPNNCTIRVWNLKEETVAAMTKYEYNRVIVQGGYGSTGFGVVFDGTIKQFRVGRENQTDPFVDILAADGDIAYNYGTINQTLSRGWTQEQVIGAAVTAMKDKGTPGGVIDTKGLLGGTVQNARGKVMFGLARVVLRGATQSIGATWSIDNGAVNVLPLDGYKPGEVLVLSATTGLIGRVEQTNTGMLATCLLNPRIEVATLVQIDNRSINRLINSSSNPLGIAFNQRAGVPQRLASEAADGLYRVFVAEHEGDTRGGPWYTHITALAVNPSTKKVAGNV